MRFIPSEALAKESLVKTDYLDVFVLVQQAGGEERPEKRSRRPGEYIG